MSAAGLASDALDALVAAALAEDVGTGDVTGEATVPASRRARARITQKAPGVIFGLELAERTFRALEPDVALQRCVAEGEFRERGPVLEIEGSARALLAGERTALNFLQRLSGVATLTHACVQAVAGTGTRILDTRKTTPGLRRLEKAAVHAGGGVNHRVGLYDEFLIKENHAAMAGGVGAAVRAAAAHRPGLTLVVETETLAEVDEALTAWTDAQAAGNVPAGTRFRILLDNMDLPGLAAAVARVDGRAETEASGGVTLTTLGDVARTGVDFISVGALTHSAPALDLSLLLEPLS
ncbi:MAG TPA: carboxylating nicotinate-nucleotide diphosphorylase [Solirubrobacteraceae bacterium]|nr:carboxylating nicotinate-nucleotide diphosphorylase [Solirubrobacteraceae bacterium]